jgi:hypothetical protein
VLRKMGLMLSDNVYKELQHALSVYSEYWSHSFGLGCRGIDVNTSRMIHLYPRKPIKRRGSHSKRNVVAWSCHTH